MSKKDEALKLALELLAVATYYSPDLQQKRSEVIDAGLKALAEQPAQQQELASASVEPVAWADLNALTEQFNSVNCGTAYRLPGEGRQPLYTSPPARKPWVGLTDIEIQDCFQQRSKDKNKERKLIADQIVKKILEKMQ